MSRKERAVLSFTRRRAIWVPVLLFALSFGAGGLRDALAAGLSPVVDMSPVVKVTGGRVKGAPAEGFPGVTVYRGIPFAAAPIGALRWREPRPVTPWKGVREPLEAVPACIQAPDRNHLPWTEEYMHQGAVSEDCLFLNVWTPKQQAAGARLPVLVYVYGGGFTSGSIAVQIYDGAALANKGAVIVEVNYRVGALGFLAHPDLTRESSHHASGNYGLLDQVAGLRWVRQNIAAFGGDPGRVTVFGQSAGALSVYLLTASPLAKGLLQRAIVQSGPGALAAFGWPSVKSLTSSREEAEMSGQALASAFAAKSIAELRAIDAQRLLSPPAVQGSPPPRFGPDVDGWFLPADAETIYAQHRENDVPIIIGAMKDEASAFPGYTPARAAEVGEASIAGVDQVLTQRAAAGRAVAYAYFFEHAIPWPEHPEYGAFHSGELPYVFDNLRLLNRPWTDADRKLASVVSSYWINFATTGDPNGPGLPKWTPYRAGSRSFLVFAQTVDEKVLKH